MTWNELAAEIKKLGPKVRTQKVRFVRDLDGPNQQVDPLRLAMADRDVYHGISVGSDLTFVAGHPFLEVDR